MKYMQLKVAVVCAAMFLGTNVVSAAEDAHKGHNHAAEGKKGSHGHEGKWDDLGTTTVSGLKLTAMQLGKVEAGKEGIFLVELGKGAKEPKAVRLWIGNASGEGSAKAKAEKDGDAFDGHVEVPKTLAADSALWVEVQPQSGARIKASFDFKK